MSGMNFIPASMAQHQKNQRILNEGGKIIFAGALCLLLCFLLINAFNKHLSREVEQLNRQKTKINSLLEDRKQQTKEFKDIQNISASLHQLNSFATLTQTLALINQSIPAETELSSIESLLNSEGESLSMLGGVSDSHKNLTSWVKRLKSNPEVLTVEVMTSSSVQTGSADELKQSFMLKIVHRASGEVS
ncbi:MAG: hypothetical protein ACPGSC_08705 [Granulosicoccaceae bacterium]